MSLYVMNSVSKHILFITSSRIGDAVLSSGLLREMIARYPGARFTIACGPLAVSLFHGVPGLEEIIPIHKQDYNKHWFDLWRRVVLKRFDAVVDLRNSAVSRLVLSRERYIFGARIDQSLHKVEQMAQVMRLGHVPAPKLWFSAEQKARALELIPAGTAVLGVGPTANWIGKTWPVERFVEVVRWMRADDGLMPDARIAVFAAPGEEDAARELLLSVPEIYRIDLIAKADPGTAAACLARCSYYIGNDSGLMHCSAAAGVPTFGVFGPSYPAIYAPWGPHTSYARTPESFDELIHYEGYSSSTCGSLMNSLSVDMVKEGIKKSWGMSTSSE